MFFMSISIEYFNDACHNVNRRTGGILMKIFKNLENGSVVEGLLMDVVPNGYRELKAGEVDAARGCGTRKTCSTSKCRR